MQATHVGPDRPRVQHLARVDPPEPRDVRLYAVDGGPSSVTRPALRDARGSGRQLRVVQPYLHILDDEVRGSHSVLQVVREPPVPAHAATGRTDPRPPDHLAHLDLTRGQQ